MYESKTMLELWEIKEQVNKELAGKSFEEVKAILDESSRRVKEKMKKFEMEDQKNSSIKAKEL
jgi:hypothetical protein